MLHAKAPSAVSFDEYEIYRIQRAQLALLLHKFPSEIDDLSVQDFYDVLDVHAANEEIEAWFNRPKNR